MDLDPDPAEMRRLGYRAVDRAVDHLSALRTRRVATPPVAAELRELLTEPLPRAPLGLEASLDRWFDRILPRATLVNHPRFFAYIPGPGSFAGALGEWLAAATNLFVGSWLGGAVMAQLELQTLDWVREALGLPADFGAGILTTGGSMANLGALAAALRHGRDRGNARIYPGSEAHYSMAKAARILGLGDEQIRILPADASQRLDPEALARAIAEDLDNGHVPRFLCATAGTTATGAIDPIDACATLCATHGMWLHVDGAYGGAAAILPEFGELRAWLARADSITIDPHK
jgi:glutamate/tyrosine decarboxylase-like PLP-dependent enzyme